MNDLPTNQLIPQISGGSFGVGGKELEPAIGDIEQPVLKDVTAKEIELPKEVISAGVKIQPTTVQLPQNVTNMGVTPIGNTVVAQPPAIALPLTDDQIALGLKQSIVSSWRWLAEWCVRRLKQIHRKVVKSL